MSRLLLLLSLTGAVLSLGGLYVLLGLHLFGPDWRFLQPREPATDRLVETALTGLRDRLSKIENRPPADLGPVRQELARLSGRLAAIEKQRAARTGQIATLHRLIETTQRTVKEVALKPIPKAVDLAPVDAALAGLRRDLAMLAAEAKSAPRKFAPAMRQIDVLAGEIRSLRSEATSLRKETTLLRQDVSALSKRSAELASRPPAPAVDLDPVKTAIAKVNRDLSSLSKGHAASGVGLETVRRSLATLRHDLNEVASRSTPAVDLAPIKKAIKGLQDDMAVLARKSASAPRSSPSDSAALRKKLDDGLFRLQKAISDLRLDFSILRDAQRN